MLHTFLISAIPAHDARFIVPDLTIKLTVKSDISNRYTSRVPDNTDMACDSNTNSLAYYIELQLDRCQLTVVPIVQTLSATCVLPKTLLKNFKVLIRRTCKVIQRATLLQTPVNGLFLR